MPHPPPAARLEIADAVLRVTFDRPETLNALDPGTVRAVADAVEAAGADPAIRAVVLTGAGRAFSSGANLVLARESAYFLLAFAGIGLMPDAGATALVPAAAGRIRATRMAMLSERVDVVRGAVRAARPQRLRPRPGGRRHRGLRVTVRRADAQHRPHRGARRRDAREARWKLTREDLDAYEINEAFAPVPLVWQHEVDADPAKLNPRGGAIALGHPLGASGTRLLATLVNHLEATGGRYGLQSMCEGGGMANATIIERLG